MAEFKPAPVKPTVPFDVFQQIDVRMGSVVAVDDIPSSSKLLKLTVDFGDHRRTIVAGLKKERPDPQALIGVQALFVINLEPRKMAGELSEGMLFGSCPERRTGGLERLGPEPQPHQRDDRLGVL
jgi:tRNA-binding protein